MQNVDPNFMLLHICIIAIMTCMLMERMKQNCPRAAASSLPCFISLHLRIMFQFSSDIIQNRNAVTEPSSILELILGYTNTNLFYSLFIRRRRHIVRWRFLDFHHCQWSFWFWSDCVVSHYCCLTVDWCSLSCLITQLDAFYELSEPNWELLELLDFANAKRFYG